MKKKADVLKLDPKDGDTVVITLGQDIHPTTKVMEAYQQHLKALYEDLDLRILVLPHDTKIEVIATSKMRRENK